jgi:hypothetical protein
MHANLLALLLAVSAARAQGPALDDGAYQLTEPWRFVVIGDYGTTEPESFAVAALVRALEPLLVLTVGDNNYPSGAATTIDENVGQHYRAFIHPYVGSYGAGARSNRFFPSLGNHDWSTSGAQPYLDYFELPGNERYYDFRRGPVHFFALDSDAHEPDGVTRDSAQAAWLENELRASDAPFRIVYLHHAPYSSGSNHGSQGELQWPFKEWGASLVLAGHDHVYERVSIAGLPYIVNGLGGRDTYTFDDALGGSELRFNDAHGALLIEADREFAHLRFMTSDGSVQDDFVLPRGGVDPLSVELVAEDARWRYLDTGVYPGGRWKRPEFDDSGWPRGRAQLGYGEGDEATVVSYGGDPTARHITTWLRTSFALSNPDEFERLQLRLLFDDGAVVYLNGVEVARARMPSGVITPDTLASGSASGNEEVTFTPFVFDVAHLRELHPHLLAVGRNVLAIELHQASRSSNDLSLAAELVGLRRGATLLERRSAWRYRDTGLDPGPSWKEPSFDDSQWSVGPAQLGHGEGDEATVVASGPTTFWFRNQFDVTDAAGLRWLSCRLLRDDGAILYLNGREAARFNLPRAAVTPATFASFNVGQDRENSFEGTSLDPRLLHDGVNTIAVELHQSSAASNDLSFDLELVGF